MTGKIVKAVSGFYYVNVDKNHQYCCRARGIFRNTKQKILIGDNVRIEVTHPQDMEGNVIEVLPRQNSLIRPTVANVDQALIVFSVMDPYPNINLLDKFLVAVAKNQIEPLICFNKSDLRAMDEIEKYDQIYRQAGYQTFITSVYEQAGLEPLDSLLQGKTTVFAGPSGVGKSSIINIIQQHTHMPIGAVSDKIRRGKHTTRHANLIALGDDSFVVDTPGFSSLSIDEIEPEELKNYFREFLDYNNDCKFRGCVHINEPNCAIKTRAEQGKIHESRYQSYVQLYDELKQKRRW